MKTLLQNLILLRSWMRWGLFQRFRFRLRQGVGDSSRSVYHLGNNVSGVKQLRSRRYLPPRVNFLNLPPLPRPAPGGPPGAMIMRLRELKTLHNLV
jgi:hypothetical protein